MLRFTLTVCTLLALANALGWAADENSKVSDPKPIALKTVASDRGIGQPGLTTFASAAELEKKFPKHADRFDRTVDLKSEDLILVSWGSSGPPFGKLTYKKDKTSIIFSVEEPKAEIRGQAYKLGADWYTVAKGTKVVMSK